ncbi:hypothetical protein B0T20DRAFT_120716 [Sordaria brevicollis]|uniref:Uncharacterized protein n=1 Tax=Sordaria brevicollis TaxID=83679 RepID=A0AAE0UEW0_SORBR|nr:hypothetical protein B0T20DRAFT_120716 [Sordaria brevicollis]
MNNTAANVSSTTASATMTGFMPGPHCGRGTLDIIWTCLSTTLLAIWVSLHTYISADSSDEKLTWRTALTTFWEGNGATAFAVLPPFWKKLLAAGYFALVPEDAVTCAVRDLDCAMRLRRNVATIPGFEEFSLQLAFVVTLRGIHYKSDDEECDTGIIMDEGDLLDFAQAGRMEFEDLPSDEEINDRNKSNQLLKSISIFQTAWFVGNILYRLSTGLGVSLLEDLTAAYAVCGFVQFIAWFHCPQDINRPFTIVLREKEKCIPKYHYQDTFDAPDEAILLFGFPLLNCVAFAASVLVFTGIHLATWKYAFASVAEMWLWRFCSMATILGLLPAFIIWGLLPPSGHLNNRQSAGLVLVILLGTLYVSARVIIIVIAFAAFRSAPLGIYKDASWTDLIPHI